MSVGDRLTEFSRRIAGDTVQRDLEPYRAKIEAVNAMAPQLERSSDSELQARAQVLKAARPCGRLPGAAARRSIRSSSLSE